MVHLHGSVTRCNHNIWGTSSKHSRNNSKHVSMEYVWIWATNPTRRAVFVFLVFLFLKVNIASFVEPMKASESKNPKTRGRPKEKASEKVWAQTFLRILCLFLCLFSPFCGMLWFRLQISKKRRFRPGISKKTKLKRIEKHAKRKAAQRCFLKKNVWAKVVEYINVNNSLIWVLEFPKYPKCGGKKTSPKKWPPRYQIIRLGKTTWRKAWNPLMSRAYKYFLFETRIS